jgi:hypothetical protein
MGTLPKENADPRRQPDTIREIFFLAAAGRVWASMGGRGGVAVRLMISSPLPLGGGVEPRADPAA